jgi:hypothetical protein
MNCKWCGEETTITGEIECDNCWEIRTRAEKKLDAARKILTAIEAEHKPKPSLNLYETTANFDGGFTSMYIVARSFTQAAALFQSVEPDIPVELDDVELSIKLITKNITVPFGLEFTQCE